MTTILDICSGNIRGTECFTLTTVRRKVKDEQEVNADYHLCSLLPRVNGEGKIRVIPIDPENVGFWDLDASVTHVGAYLLVRVKIKEDGRISVGITPKTDEADPSLQEEDLELVICAANTEYLLGKITKLTMMDYKIEKVNQTGGGLVSGKYAEALQDYFEFVKFCRSELSENPMPPYPGGSVYHG